MSPVAVSPPRLGDVTVQKTYPSDFDKIYPLLTEFDSPYTKDDWRRIFTYQWPGAEDYVGFHLEHGGQPVGFMGLVFSVRKPASRDTRFCNITSLIVKASHRPATILLLRRLAVLEQFAFIGLRPIDQSFRLLTAIGFVPYEDHYRIVPAVASVLGRRRRLAEYEGADLLTRVDPEGRRIATDHEGLQCASILFSSGEGQCLMVYKVARQRHRRILVTKIHVLYISDVSFFNQQLFPILARVKARWGSASALYVDGRFLSAVNARYSIARPLVPPRICSKARMHPLDIDELYSETVLL